MKLLPFPPATSAVLLAGLCCCAPRPGVAPDAPRTVRITASRYEFSPSEIHVRMGEPVELELTSLDRTHGFDAPDLGLHAAIDPGEPTQLAFVPDRPGRFLFHCDVFCGSGHEDMSGEIVVDP